MLLVRWRHLVAVVFVRAAKEEVNRSTMKSKQSKKGRRSAIDWHRTFIQGAAVCVQNQKSMMSSFNLLTW